MYINILSFILGIIDIDGPVDMKLIFGIIVVEEKDNQGKEDKVSVVMYFINFLIA